MERLLDLLADDEEAGGRGIDKVASMEALLIEQRKRSSERESERGRGESGC